MAGTRSVGTRVVALGLAVFLIGGGIATLSTHGALAASKVGAAVAILAGLVFLRMAARR